jgi:hypothetical protein
MEQYINKSAIENILRELWIEDRDEKPLRRIYYNKALQEVQCKLDNLEVKEIKEDSLEKFKSLQHISGDLHQTLGDWGYAPNLYFFDRMWHVSWISCEEEDTIKDFEGNTSEEAIDKAFNWFHSTFCNS